MVNDNSYFSGIVGNSTSTPSEKVDITGTLKSADYDLIKRNFDKKVHLYPNPNDGNFKLVFNGKISEEIEVNIFDVFGKLVHSISSKESEIDFKLDNLNSGVYFVKINSSDINESIKFIKK